SAYYGMGPIFAADAGMSVFQVSLFMASVILGGMVLQWPIGRISDRLDRRTVLLGVLGAVTVTCAVGVAVTALHGQFYYYLLVGVVMGSMTTVYPISVAQAFDYLPQSKYVAASSSLLLAYSVGATAGPILVSLAMGAFGLAAFFGFIGVGAASVGGFAFHRMMVRRPLPLDEQEPIVPVPRMSPVVAEMDPRCPAPDDEILAPAMEDRAR
ncbi:MAG: MFS transporter, partial [Kiloniellaceae bacterium]